MIALTGSLIKSSIVAERFLKGTKMEPKYLMERQPDWQYHRNMRTILYEGALTKNPKQDTGTVSHLCLPKMEYDLRNGIPMITERNVGGFWKKPIAELLAFVHGVRDASVLAKEWKVNWWLEQWATSEKCSHFGLEAGDMGPGSYGPGFNPIEFQWEEVIDHPDGGRYVPQQFRQFEHLIKQIKWAPSLRTHRITPWLPHYCLQHEGLVRKVVVAPCHGDLLVTIIDGQLTLQMVQRSGDWPIGVPSNLIQYAALTIMIAHVTGFEPRTFIHVPQDAQIYTDQIPWVEEIIRRKPKPFPTLHLTEEGKQVTNLFDFRPDHFELRGYDPHPAIKDIPVTT